MKKPRTYKKKVRAILTQPSEVAIHEAAHALMFDALGIEIERVSVEPLRLSTGKWLEGHVLLKNKTNCVEAVLLGTSAGPVASYKLADFAGSLTEFLTDHDVIKDIHKNFVEETRKFEEFWTDLQRLSAGWVSGFIYQHRGAIMRLAKILTESKTLEGTALQEAFSAAWQASKPNTDAVCSDAKIALARITGFPKKR